MGKTFSDLADYLDKTVAEAEAPVKEYFEDHPYQAQIVLGVQQGIVNGTAPFPIIDGFGKMVAHPADAARGYADMFRLGTGTADVIDGGSPIGVVKDLKRGVGIVATVWGLKNTAGNSVRLAVGNRQAALLRDVPGGACAPMSATYVLRKTGQKPLVKVDDFVKAVGGNPKNVLDYRLGRAGLIEAFKKMKVKPRELTHPGSMNELTKVMRKEKGIAVFGVKWIKPNGKEARHVLVAFRDKTGVFKIWDRTGKVVSKLDDLNGFYPGIKNAVLEPGRHPLMIFDGVSVAAPALAVSEGAKLVIQVTPALAVSQDEADPELVVQAIESKVQRAKGRAPETLPKVEIRLLPRLKQRRKAPRSDYLTGVKYRLNHLGYGAGPVVHVYDERCRRAIRAFQRDYRLRVDSIPGPRTQARLVGVVGY